MENKNNSVVEVKGIKFGGNNPLVFLAGPCTVENKEQASRIHDKLLPLGVQFFRGGAFKPRTSPYSFQGLGYEGLKILKDLKMPVISEITAIEQIPSFLESVDIIQVGARNMSNYELLKALGKIDKPILLKRGFSATIEEWLCAAEYILMGGNKNVILCERGIRTFDDKARFTLDIAAITYVKRMSNFPLVVDPSHAAGKSFLVKDLALAAVAAGADGLLIEVNDEPSTSVSDSKQAITPDELKEIMDKANRIKEVIK